jgi:hypothetical protein
MSLITEQRSIFEIVEDTAPVAHARSSDEEIARGLVAWWSWLARVVEEEADRVRAAEARRRRVAAKELQEGLTEEERAWWRPGMARVHLPVIHASSETCGQPTTCRRLSCPANTTLDVGDEEIVNGRVYRVVTLHQGPLDGRYDPERGRRPAFNVEEQVDAVHWGPFEAQVLTRLDEMEEAGFSNCSDRFARRVRTALEDAEDSAETDEERRAVLQDLDDATLVALGRVLGLSDESIRLSCRSAEAKLRSWADDAGYTINGDVTDLAEAILFGAGVE